MTAPTIAPTTTPHLFSPLTIGPITVPNRVAVAPMCQYMANDGAASDWHIQHLMQLAMSRAGLVVLEATGVERIGRITHHCLGLYTDLNEAALARAMDAARRVASPDTKWGIQLAHAGRPHAERDPARRAEQVAQHRYAVAKRMLEQQSRAAGAQRAVADLGHLQIWRNRGRNGLKFAHLLQLRNKIS